MTQKSDIPEVESLRRYNYLYRMGTPEIDDKTYDHLYDIVKAKYPDDPFFSEVGLLGEGYGRDVELEYLLGSLRKHHKEDVAKWLQEHDNNSGFCVSDKMDGLSVTTTWENKKLSHSELRGDGTIGKDCTDKVKVILKNKSVDFDKLVLRGEITLRANPEELKALGMKNRRNGAVGIMKRETLENVDKLSIHYYEMIEAIKDGVSVLPDRESLRINLIQKLGFKIPRTNLIVGKDYNKMAALLEEMTENIDKTDYDADGSVVCVEFSNRENVLLPELKIAYKKKDELVETTITRVGYQVSRLGRVVPVVYYEPVEIGGATCTKATAHNFDFMVTNQIGVGSRILICRSQEVIPYISGVTHKEGFVIPATCPECGSQLYWDDNNIHLLCKSIDCPAQSLKNITHYFVSLGLEEYSESSFEKLGVKSIFDVYKLTEDDILKIDGFGKKSAKDFVDRVKATKKTKPELLIKSLGINSIGRTLGKIITSNFSWNKIKIGDLTVDQLMTLPNIGEKRAKLLISNLKQLAPTIQKLEEIGVTVESSSGPLNGKTFCVTGKLETMTRSQIESWIIDRGGEVSGIKKIPNMYLVTNEASNSAKYKKAMELGVPVISEQDLLKLGE